MVVLLIIVKKRKIIIIMIIGGEGSAQSSLSGEWKGKKKRGGLFVCLYCYNNLSAGIHRDVDRSG